MRILTLPALYLVYKGLTTGAGFAILSPPVPEETPEEKRKREEQRKEDEKAVEKQRKEDEAKRVEEEKKAKIEEEIIKAELERIRRNEWNKEETKRRQNPPTCAPRHIPVFTHGVYPVSHGFWVCEQIGFGL